MHLPRATCRYPFLFLHGTFGGLRLNIKYCFRHCACSCKISHRYSSLHSSSGNSLFPRFGGLVCAASAAGWAGGVLLNWKQGTSDWGWQSPRRPEWSRPISGVHDLQQTFRSDTSRPGPQPQPFATSTGAQRDQLLMFTSSGNTTLKRSSYLGFLDFHYSGVFL